MDWASPDAPHEREDQPRAGDVHYAKNRQQYIEVEGHWANLYDTSAGVAPRPVPNLVFQETRSVFIDSKSLVSADADLTQAAGIR